MHRLALDYLSQYWLLAKDRKPLVIKGARQVGKTWLVRTMAKQQGPTLLEFNFEKTPNLISLFQTNDHSTILQNLEVYFGHKIDVTNVVLFFDEIQAAPQLFAKLRWFYEDLPSLPVIATGSLLELILQDQAISMPVGRISYLYLEPLSFAEFLMAIGKESLLKYIKTLEPPFVIAGAIHESLSECFRDYVYVGGMPASVASWTSNHSITEISRIQQELLTTYREDFFKYKGRIDTQKLDSILRSIPMQLGHKFTYSKADPNIQSPLAKQILSLFYKARLCHSVYHSAGNRIPLALEIKEKVSKQIFLDIGLVNRFLNVSLISSNFSGGVTEQVVGQILRTLFPFYIDPALYCWQRDEVGSSAEIDYLIEHDNSVIPIEVKSGSSGSLKSLHFFMQLKKYKVAVRINSDLPSITTVSINMTNQETVSYDLLSIPFYLVGELHRLLGSISDA